MRSLSRPAARRAHHHSVCLLVPLCAGLLGLVMAGPVHAASIGVYADPDCQRCQIDIPAPPAFDSLYVRLSTTDLPWYTTQWDISVRFRLEIPEGWFTSVRLTADPQYIQGDPLGPDGVALWFGGGHLAGDCIPLYTIGLAPIPFGAPGVVRVVPSTFTNSWCGPQDCPYVMYELLELYCHCVGAGALFVNTPGGCTLGVQASTWSSVKRLYE